MICKKTQFVESKKIDMINKKILLSELLNFLGKDLINIYGSAENRYFDNLSSVENVNETTLDWVNPSKKNKQEIAEKSLATIILTDDNVKYSKNLKENNKTLLVVCNPKVTLAKIGNHFFKDKITPFIHSTAVIDKDAEIGKNVSIGAYSVIGKCKIGDESIIDSNVKIYDNTDIGIHCIIKSGAVLGGEGFGFEKDENGNLFRFPQLAALKIGNYVEIGANTSIDHGALTDTEIGDYTKINNLCHIAHNNKIGKNVIITAEVNLSGSNVIEDNVWIAPNSSVRGWIHIGKGATVGMGAVVVKDIPSNETWVGCPAKKLR